MADNDRAAELLDGIVIGSDGETIGDVGEVYTDDASGAPSWVTVKTGWFGRSESFVPLVNATIAGNQITVPFDKATIKASPNKEPDAPLSEEDEDELYRYYSAVGATTADRGAAGGSGYASSGGAAAESDAAGAARSAAERGDGDENWETSQMAADALPGRPADADAPDPGGWRPEQLETEGAAAGTYAGATAPSGALGDRSDDPNWKPEQLETQGATTGTYRETGTEGLRRDEGHRRDEGLGRSERPVRTEVDDARVSTGDRSTGEAVVTRSEERLSVGTERVATGRVRLRKYVVTEVQTIQVPVTREEVRLERVPITPGEEGDLTGEPRELGDEEASIVLTEERAVVTKETVPVERVRLEKDVVTEQRQVSEEIRKEEVEMHTDADAAGRVGDPGTLTAEQRADDRRT